MGISHVHHDRAVKVPPTVPERLDVFLYIAYTEYFQKA